MKYCFNCGSKIIGSAPKFCSECGLELITGVELNPTVPNQPKANTNYEGSEKVFKPKFRIAYHFLMSIFNSSSMFFVFFFFMFGLGALKDATENINPEYTVNYLPDWVYGKYVYYATYVLILIVLFMIVVPIFNLLFKWFSYRKTEYRIYTDRIEYREGFMTENYSKIDFEKVIEVHLKKGFIQKQFGLGTVFLEIPASGKTRNGINMKDLENSGEVYELMREMVR